MLTQVGLVTHFKHRQEERVGRSSSNVRRAQELSAVLSQEKKTIQKRFEGLLVVLSQTSNKSEVHAT